MEPRLVTTSSATATLLTSGQQGTGAALGPEAAHQSQAGSGEARKTSGRRIMGRVCSSQPGKANRSTRGRKNSPCDFMVA